MGKKNGGVPREVVLQRERDAWKFRQLGWSQRRIAEELGISQPAVCQALARISAKYTKSTMKNVAAVKGEQIVMLEEIRDDAMQAWRRSQLDYQEMTVRRQRVTDENAENIDADTLEDWPLPEDDDSNKRLEITTIVTRGQVGDPRFLKIAMEASAEIRKITGIDNNDKLYALIIENFDWDKATPEQLRRLKSGEDPLAVIFGTR